MTNDIHSKKKLSKTTIGILSIACSILSILLGFIIRKPLIDVISVGFILSFAALIISLAAVKNTGSNIIAQIAFWLGFISMWITIFLGASV